MKKIIFLTLALMQFLSAETIEIDKFTSDIFSKIKNGTKKIEMSLTIEGRDVEEENSFKIVDGLNIVVGSFYFEDLMTSRGKENFKNTLKLYVTEKYRIDIDEIYIKYLFEKESASTKEIIEAMKEAGCCKEK